MVEGEIAQVVSFHTAADNEAEWNLQEIYEVANTIFPLAKEARVKLSDIEREAGNKFQDAKARTKIINYIYGLAIKSYDQLESSLDTYLNDKLAMRKIEKGLMLRVIDSLWVDHLEAIDSLRAGIGLRGYGQRDPLIEYKKESFKMFTELMNLIQKQFVYSIFKIGVAQKLAPSVMEDKNITMTAPPKTMEKGQTSLPQGNFSATDSMKKDVASRESQASVKSGQTHFQGQKVGRNDSCPCGATKPDGTPVKFKHCHGK